MQPGWGNWGQVFEKLDALDTHEMLLALAALDSDDLENLRDCASGLGHSWEGEFNFARMAYAIEVVQTRRLPAKPPSDLPSGAVQAAKTFLAHQQMLRPGEDRLALDVCDMFASEPNHLKAFVGLIAAGPLLGFLKNHKWTAFAAQWNGKGFKENNYDTNLENAFAVQRLKRAKQGLTP
jgi:hypothetical protein